MTKMTPNRSSEPGHRVQVAIERAPVPGRWVVRRRAQVELSEGFFHRRCTQMDADSFGVFGVLGG